LRILLEDGAGEIQISLHSILIQSGEGGRERVQWGWFMILPAARPTLALLDPNSDSSPCRINPKSINLEGEEEESRKNS
jgi:hypothetical protein